MSSWLIIVDTRRTQSMRVMNKALKIADISKSHLGLNISIKVNEMLIVAIVIFEASFCENGQRPEVL